MSRQNKIGRRAACAGMLAVGGGLLLPHAAPGNESAKKTGAPLGTFRNGDFYDADGKLNQARAKAAYFALLKHYGYPLNDNVRNNIFVSDFGLGRFTEVGLGGVLWLDEKEGNYASIEVFLLPNQMIPEHWHVPLEAEGVGPKVESWIVRYGSTFAYGEGEPTKEPAVKIHACQAKHVTVMHETALRPGEVAGVKRPLAKHWQQAGPKGCILTEVSTYHAGEAVKFTDPKIKF